MYISRQTYEGDHHTVTPYKEFPTNILLENITCLLNEQSSSELESLKNLESMLRHTNNQEQVLIDYIHKNGTQDPNDIMTTEIDIDNELGYYRFHLAYNETSFYHFAYSNTYEEDWESCITYHEKFEDEEITND
jgi:hypothetical protein